MDEEGFCHVTNTYNTVDPGSRNKNIGEPVSRAYFFDSVVGMLDKI
jgi:hypothetical protein